MKSIMILLKLLQRWKNFRWYCIFNYGNCYVILAEERMIRILIISGISHQIEPQDSFIAAIKYFITYNKGADKNGN